MKTAKIYIQIIVSFFSILLFSTKWNFDNAIAFDTIATFLSITIGFTITALSIIATSSFSRNLYNLQDRNNNSRTLLHILVSQFRTSTFIFVFTIAWIIIYKFLPTQSCPIILIKGYQITFQIIIKAIIWYLTIISFLTFLKLFYTFSKFVTKNASN